MSIEVLRSVLAFAIDRLVKILDEDGQALHSASQLRRTHPACSRPVDHDPRVAQMHLRAADRPSRLPMAVVFREAECLRHPSNRIRTVLTNQVWHPRILCPKP